MGRTPPQDSWAFQVELQTDRAGALSRPLPYLSPRSPDLAFRYSPANERGHRYLAEHGMRLKGQLPPRAHERPGRHARAQRRQSLMHNDTHRAERPQRASDAALTRALSLGVRRGSLSTPPSRSPIPPQDAGTIRSLPETPQRGRDCAWSNHSRPRLDMVSPALGTQVRETYRSQGNAAVACGAPLTRRSAAPSPMLLESRRSKLGSSIPNRSLAGERANGIAPEAVPSAARRRTQPAYRRFATRARALSGHEAPLRRAVKLSLGESCAPRERAASVRG